MPSNNDKWNKLSPEEKIDIIMEGYGPENGRPWPYHIENGKIYIATTGDYPQDTDLEVTTIESFIASYTKKAILA